MNHLFSFRYTTFLLVSSLLISACNDEKDTDIYKINPLMTNPIEMKITSINDLNTFYKEHQYNNNNWEKNNQKIPRITFNGIAQYWPKTSQKMPVKAKKLIFFQLMTPLTLVANERILNEREIVKKSDLEDPNLKKIALKYRVIKDITSTLNEAARDTLLSRVDILPPSLALAQSAKESGWATSRFTLQGNAFFGQWDFSGEGMKPLSQRKELGNYGVARFPSPLASVEGYMLNINTNKAYQQLRTLRSQLRGKKKSATGIELAATLGKYSEQGESYINGLKSIIRHNKLETIDQAHLANNKLIHLLFSK